MTNSFSCNSTRLPETMASARALATTLPVASPPARTTRGTECAPSEARMSLPSRRSNLAPSFSSSRTRAGPLLHQHPHRVVVAQAHAGLERVLEVEFGRVVVADGRRDAALGEEGGGLVEVALGDEAHVPAVARPPPRPSARRCRRR